MEGDAEQVGRRTTTAVVQAIFLVIVLDAFFAAAFSARSGGYEATLPPSRARRPRRHRYPRPRSEERLRDRSSMTAGFDVRRGEILGGRRLGHRQVGADALDHRAADADGRRSKCSASTIGREGDRGDRTAGAGAYLSRAARCSPRLTALGKRQVPALGRILSSSIRRCSRRPAPAKVVMTGRRRKRRPNIPLSFGGMKKRAGFAAAGSRSIPSCCSSTTAGLDPIGAAALTSLPPRSRRPLGLTVFLITRSRHALCHLRPGRGAGGQESDRTERFPNCSPWTIHDPGIASTDCAGARQSPAARRIELRTG